MGLNALLEKKPRVLVNVMVVDDRIPRLRHIFRNVFAMRAYCGAKRIGFGRPYRPGRGKRFCAECERRAKRKVR